MDIKKEKRKLGNYLDKIDKIKKSIIDTEESNFTELEILKNYLSKAMEEVILLNYKLESQSTFEQQQSLAQKNELTTPTVAQIEEVPVVQIKEPVQKVEEIKRVVEPGPLEIKEATQHIEKAPSSVSKQTVGSINDRLKTERREINSLSTFARSISDLISLNDRIAFTNDLLKKDKSAYDKLLNAIDHSDSYDESFRYIQENIATKYDWDEDDQVVKQFYHLLDLKFK